MNNILTNKQLEDKLQELSYKYYHAFIEKNEDEVMYLREHIFIYVLDYLKRKVNAVCKNELNETDKEEVIQETMQMLLKKLDNNEYSPYYNETSKFSAFLIGLMIGKYENVKAKNNRRNKHIDAYFEEKRDEEAETKKIEQIKDTYNEASKDIHLDEIIDKILSIAKNDEEKKFINIVFIQRVLYDDIALNEVAELFGWSPAYVTKKTIQLKDKLREVLAEYNDEQIE